MPSPPPDDGPLRDDEGFLARYRELCASLGVDPVSDERARELVEHWNAILTGAVPLASKPH